MRCKLCELAWRAMPRNVVRRRTQHAMIRREPPRDQMRRDLVADTDIEVEAFAAHVDETVEQIEPHAQLRIALGETRKRGRDEAPAETEAARNAQLAGRNAARGGDVFDELIRRVRGGDEAAAAELVRCYEPVVRRFVRVRLAGSRLRRLFDSRDICQEVLGSFFARAARGQYELDSPEGLLSLLVVMARKKVAMRARRRQPDQANAAAGPPGHLGNEPKSGGPK